MTHHVYQVLDITGNGSPELMALAGMNGPQAGLAANHCPEARPGDKWLIQSSDQDGFNVHYQLWMVCPRGREYRPVPPCPDRQPCPNCQGQGLVYRWNRDQSAYEAAQCEECRGDGADSYDGEIAVTVNDGVGGRRTIRKQRGGRLSARLGLLGDLILNIAWTEKPPSAA